MIVSIAPRLPDRRTETAELRLEVDTLRAETAAAGRYLRLVGGRLVHLIEADYDLQARHLAVEVIRLGDRLVARGNGSDAA